MSAGKILEWTHAVKGSYYSWERNYRLISTSDGFIMEVEIQPGLWIMDKEGDIPLKFRFPNDVQTFINHARCPKPEDTIEVQWEGYVASPYELCRLKKQNDPTGDLLLIRRNGEVIHKFDSRKYEEMPRTGIKGKMYPDYRYNSIDVKKYFRDFVLEREPMLNEQYRIQQEKIHQEEREEKQRVLAAEKLNTYITSWKENTIILDIIPKINNKPWLPPLPKVIRGERYHVLNQLLKHVWEHEDNGNKQEANRIAEILEENHVHIENLATIYKAFTKRDETRYVCKERISITI